MDYHLGKRCLIFSLNKMEFDIGFLGHIENLGILSVDECFIYEKEGAVITTVIGATNDAS